MIAYFFFCLLLSMWVALSGLARPAQLAPEELPPTADELEEEPTVPLEELFIL